MARISTGKELGGVVKATPQRLLGGAQISGGAAGELAAAEIAAPGLEPQANLVNTFQQTGAPTLGGPVRIPAPPDLPGPSQDMGNLAKALADFNPNLWRVGGAYMEIQEQLDKKREEEAVQFVQQAGRYGPITGLADLQRTLEKKSGEGDPGAGKLLQYFLSRNPAMWRWIAEKTQETAILNNVASLAKNARQTQFVDDGAGGQVELSSLGPDDERYLNWQSQQIFRDTVVSPAVMSRYNNLIIQARSSDFDRQEKAHIDHRVKEYRAASGAKLQSLSAGFLTNTLDYQSVTQELQALVDDPRLIGLPLKERQEALLDLASQWKSAIVSSTYAQGNPEAIKDAFVPFALLMTGPEDQRFTADGKPNENLRLINALGGPEFTLKLKSEFQSAYIQMYNQDQQLTEISVQSAAGGMIAQALTPEVMKNPAEAARIKDALGKQFASQYAGNPVALHQALSMLNQQFGDRDAVYNDLARENLASEYVKRLSQAAVDPTSANSLRQEVMRAMENKWVTPEKANSILNTLDTYARADARPYRDVANELIGAKLDQWELYSKSPDSYGSTLIDDYEVNSMAKAKGLMQQESARVISEGVKAGKSSDQINNDLQNLFKNRNFGLKFREGTPQEKEKKQVSATPQEWRAKNIGWLENLTGGGSPTPDQRNRLRNQVKNQPLYGRDILGKQLDTVINGGQLDDDTKLMIRRAGMRPSEFFLNQLKQHNILDQLNEDTIRKIKALDGTLKVSSVSPMRSMPYVAMDPYVRQMRAIGEGIATASLNVIAPPAMAAPTPLGLPAVTGSVNVAKLRQSIIGKESGGNFSAVNPDSGALGYGQVMPYNVGPWTAKYFGRRLTPSQYLRNPQAQIQVMNGVIGSYVTQQLEAGHKPDVAIRRAAAMWYGGPKSAKLYDDNKPQYYNRRRYPSFREYTTDILRKYTRS